IRSQMGEDGALWGFVEADETYIGGQPRIKGVSRRGRGTKKVPVLGAVERSGKVVTRVVDRVKREELMSFLTERVERGSTIYTDELNLYAPLTALGYTHDTVQHRTKEYSRLNE